MTGPKSLASILNDTQPAASPEATPGIDLSNIDLSALDPRNFGIDPSIFGLDPGLFDTPGSNSPAIPRPGDGAQISPEAAGEMGSAQPASGNSSGNDWNQQLVGDIQSVMQAQSQGADPQAATNGLAQDYTQALQQRAKIDPQIEAAVHAILGGQAPAGGASGGSAPAGGGSPASAGGGGGAPAGGSGGSSGGGGSVAPIGNNGQGSNGGNSGGTSGNGPGETWSGQMAQSLNSALSASPQAFQNSIGSWAQGQQGDCASIAVIKAAMNEYGNQVLSNVTQGPQGYNITMQDGFQETITPQMLNQASQMADFTGADNSSKAYGTLLFAAMAGRAAQQGVDGINTYSGALQDMVSGYNPTVAATNLGLQNRMVSVNPSNLGNDASVVGWSSQHAVFVQNGSSVDHYGTVQGYNGTDTLGNNLTNAFEFTPASYPSQGYSVGPRPASPRQTPSAPSGPFRPGSARSPGVPRAVGFSPARGTQTRAVRNAPTSTPSPHGGASPGGWGGSSPWTGARHPSGRRH